MGRLMYPESPPRADEDTLDSRHPDYVCDDPNCNCEELFSRLDTKGKAIAEMIALLGAELMED